MISVQQIREIGDAPEAYDRERVALRSREIRRWCESREQGEVGASGEAYEEHRAAVGAPLPGVTAGCFNGVSHVLGGCGSPGFSGYPIAGVRHHVSPGSEHRDEPCGVGFRSTLPAATSDKNYQWRRTSWLLCGVVDVQVLVRPWAVEEVNRARWGYTAIPARKGESHRYADQRPARQAARFQHDRYRSAESLARKLYSITKDIPADLEGTAPAPPPHRGRHASHATELPAARRDRIVPKSRVSLAAAPQRFSGSSTQGGVASIRRPNSGSSCSILTFISQAISR